MSVTPAATQRVQTTSPRDGVRRARPASKLAKRAPQLTPQVQLLRAAIVVVGLLALTLLVQVLLISQLQQTARQQRLYDHFRAQLAQGTAPIGPMDANGKVLGHGSAVAYLEIPAIGLRQVVVEGTTSSDLFVGPGHRRDTPLPGQVGTSLVLGRRAMFGGPFSKISQLKAGDLIRVTTGQGVFQYKVLGVRHEGDPIPEAVPVGGSRLTLATAGGRAFVPQGVVRVDADIDGAPVGGDLRLLTASTLPAEEGMMANDLRTLWVLALWLQALILVSTGVVWAWHLWGKPQAWIVFIPVLLLISFSAWGEFARLLPNLA